MIFLKKLFLSPDSTFFILNLHVDFELVENGTYYLVLLTWKTSKIALEDWRTDQLPGWRFALSAIYSTGQLVGFGLLTPNRGR